ncbi:MAG: DUF192 domain-containing protein [bacterium]
MNPFRQLKRITTWTIILVVAILGYRYWDNVKPIFEQISQKYNDIKEVSDLVGSVKEQIAGVETKDIVVLTPSKEVKLNVEIAKTKEEKAKGLMNRENLCENCGMLFIFDDGTSSPFGMKDCLIALDIMFLDKNGRIIDIKKDFEPCDEEECPSYAPEEPFWYAVEVNSGWTDKNKVNIGDVVIGLTSGS